MTLSVVIPCYNELSTIEKIVDAVKKHTPIESEIIIIDDASTDGTRDFLKSQPSDWVGQILYHDVNQGKGAALRTGIKADTIVKHQTRVYQVGISYYGRTYEEGKKIGWRNGVRAIYAIIKYNVFG